MLTYLLFRLPTKPTFTESKSPSSSTCSAQEQFTGLPSGSTWPSLVNIDEQFSITCDDLHSSQWFVRSQSLPTRIEQHSVAFNRPHAAAHTLVPGRRIFSLAFVRKTLPSPSVWKTLPTVTSQVRCLLSQPIFAKQGQVEIFPFDMQLTFHLFRSSLKPLQVLSGRVLMVANAKQSYDLTIECKIEVNTGIFSKTLRSFNLFISRAPTLCPQTPST